MKETYRRKGLFCFVLQWESFVSVQRIPKWAMNLCQKDKAGIEKTHFTRKKIENLTPYMYLFGIQRRRIYDGSTLSSLLNWRVHAVAESTRKGFNKVQRSCVILMAQKISQSFSYKSYKRWYQQYLLFRRNDSQTISASPKWWKCEKRSFSCIKRSLQRL